MTAIWSEERKFALWLEIEVLAAEALAERGEVPRAAIDKLRKLPAVDVARVRDLEKTSQHEVIAFLSAVAETAGEMNLKKPPTRLPADPAPWPDVVGSQAWRHKRRPMIARPHGIHAEPI